MKTRIFFFCFLAIATAGLICWISRPSEVVDAQSRSDDKALNERDKSVPEDRLDRADSEARAIMAAVKSSIQKSFPGFQLTNEYFVTGRNQALGRRGQTAGSISWSKGDARMNLSLDFMFSEEEAHATLKRGLEGISMGEFFPSPIPLGDGAVLVKNVTYNTSTTQVGLHFTRSRAKVAAYFSNYKRSTSENEKELVRFVRTVEPLIKPKSNFDDL